jgi:hypothetical protein
VRYYPKVSCHATHCSKPHFKSNRIWYKWKFCCNNWKLEDFEHYKWLTDCNSLISVWKWECVNGKIPCTFKSLVEEYNCLGCNMWSSLEIHWCFEGMSVNFCRTTQHCSTEDKYPSLSPLWGTRVQVCHHCYRIWSISMSAMICWALIFKMFISTGSSLLMNLLMINKCI